MLHTIIGKIKTPIGIYRAGKISSIYEPYIYACGGSLEFSKKRKSGKGLPSYPYGEGARP